MEKKRVLITGASGLIGRVVRERLGDSYAFSALNRRPVPGLPCVQADIADFDAIRPAFDGIEAVVHLAGYTGSAEDPRVEDWDGNLQGHIIGTRNVLEASRLAGVRRIVFVSSGCAILGYEREYPYCHLVAGEYDQAPESWPMADHTWPVRPDGIYGAAKVFGEAAGHFYSDAYGLSVLCLRIGAVLDTDRPKLRRQYPGYLSQRDVAQAIHKSIEAPETVRYGVFDIISNNRWAWRSIRHAQEVLGYEPQDSADVWEA
ncbi:MAG: putative oxidoreductase protein [Armatimonadetes bacterium]|nr:putative oxidoreductase protein [Armatimonadota bacterium]